MIGFALADNNDQDQQLQQDEPAKSLRYGGYRGHGGYYAGYRRYYGGYGGGLGRFGEYRLGPVYFTDVEKPDSRSVLYAHYGYQTK